MSLLDTLKKGIQVDSVDAMDALAVQIAKIIPADQVLMLQGDLGSGKTTFVSGLAKAWGIKKTVTSPTFNLYSIYEGERQLIHIDAYRLKGKDEFEELMLEEFMESPYCLVIEWPERLGNGISLGAWKFSFEVIEMSVRCVRIVS